MPAVIIRQRKTFRRKDGTFIYFEVIIFILSFMTRKLIMYLGRGGVILIVVRKMGVNLLVAFSCLPFLSTVKFSFFFYGLAGSCYRKIVVEL